MVFPEENYFFNTIIDEKTNSKLKIENFKVINAPGMVNCFYL